LSKRIPVFDTFATKVLFHRKRAEAEHMVASGVACELSRHPLEIRLTKPPASRTAEDLLHADRSLSMGPSVMAGVAGRDAACISLLQAWRGATLLTGRDQNGKPVWGGSKISPVVPQAFIDAGHQGSILYMPGAGKLTCKRGLRISKCPPEEPPSERIS
jgi:hypothetical protein